MYSFGGKVYITARSASRIDPGRIDRDNITLIDLPMTSEWKDPDATWNYYYKTAQAFYVNNRLYILGRLSRGVVTYVYDTKTGETYELDDVPEFSDYNGWSGSDHSLTIQTFVIGDKAYLVGRGPDGVCTYELENDEWVSEKFNIIPWSDDYGWAYRSIHTFVLNNTGYIFGYGPDGPETYQLQNDNWVALPFNLEIQEDSGSIQVAVGNKAAYLIMPAHGNSLVLKFNTKNQWKKIGYLPYNSGK